MKNQPNEVEAPCSPTALTVYEIVTVRRLVQGSRKRAVRKAEKNAASGRSAKIKGEDADLLRVANLDVLDAKIEEWLVAAFPAVNASRRTPFIPGTPSYAEARRVWLDDSHLDGPRPTVMGIAESQG